MGECDLGSVPFESEWLINTTAVLNGFYAHLHPYISVALCVLGTLMNLITVIVLTRPSMLSPVNVLLCAVAVCDILVMSSVLVFSSHFLIAAVSRCEVSDYSQFWAYFLYFHSQLTVILHATSIWLTVLLAQIRVLTIRRATAGPTDAIGARFTLVLSLITLVVCTLVNLPNMMTFEIVEIDADLWLSCLNQEVESESIVVSNATTPAAVDTNDYGAIYHVQASKNDCGVLKVAYWTNGILFKVVPCVLLTLSIVALLKIISDVANRRKTLAQVMNKKRMPRDHTTPMLVAVLSIFLVAELPQGILHVCNAIFSNETFYRTIYLNLGDLMDLFSLVNSAVNFIIYCAMSRKFRAVFLELFFACLPNRFTTDLRDEWLKQLDTSRHRPSGFTDLTRTEQLALTSSHHRPSATSTLLRSGSREHIPKLYTGNLLSVGDIQGHSPRGSLSRNSACSGVMEKQRISIDVSHKRRGTETSRNSLEIHELQLTVPTREKPKTWSWNPTTVVRSFLERGSTGHQNSPQRRINIIQCETQRVY